MTFDAVRSNRFYVFTHPQIMPTVRGAFRRGAERRALRPIRIADASVDAPALRPRMIRTGQYAELGNGIRLHYASCGDRGARPIIFLHGFPEYWGAWEDLLPEFASGVARGRARPARLQPVEPADRRSPPIARARSSAISSASATRLGWSSASSSSRMTGAVPRAGNGRSRIRSGWSSLIVLNSPHPIPFARDLVNDPAQQSARAYMNWLRAPGAEGALLKDDLPGARELLPCDAAPRTTLVHGGTRARAIARSGHAG